MPSTTLNRTVAILAYDGLCTFEFGIAVEIFGLPRPEFGVDWYRHHVVGLERGPLRAMGGLTVQADIGLEGLADAQTIIIPGWRDRREAPPDILLEALRAAHRRGARLLSICSGVFVLAATGLLDGRRATTHWRYADELAARFPAIEVLPDVLYVDEGQLITSAGSAAGIDACLHLVSRDFGTDITNQVARRLVITPQRAGGQAQFIPAPVAESPRQDFSELMAWARQQLAAPLSVSQLAARVAMSERTFLRHFIDATGVRPKRWLQHERINRARELLETSDVSLPRIAEQCGFQTPEAFRIAFRQQTGLAPSAYRQQFG